MVPKLLLLFTARGWSSQPSIKTSLCLISCPLIVCIYKTKSIISAVNLWGSLSTAAKQSPKHKGHLEIALRTFSSCHLRSKGMLEMKTRQSAGALRFPWPARRFRSIGDLKWRRSAVETKLPKSENKGLAASALPSAPYLCYKRLFQARLNWSDSGFRSLGRPWQAKQYFRCWIRNETTRTVLGCTWAQAF